MDAFANLMAAITITTLFGCALFGMFGVVAQAWGFGLLALGFLGFCLGS